MRTMRRSLAEIIADQDEIAKRFEDLEWGPEHERDIAPLNALAAAVEARAAAEAAVLDAVIAARRASYSWSLIGHGLGTSAQAAQQRYGRLVKRS